MLRSGAAIDEDVAAATDKAVKASFHSHHQHQGEGVQENNDADSVDGGMVDFVGFLEFIHGLDIEVRPSVTFLTVTIPVGFKESHLPFPPIEHKTVSRLWGRRTSYETVPHITECLDLVMVVMVSTNPIGLCCNFCTTSSPWA